MNFHKDESTNNPTTRTRRHDPGRRDRIIDACLDVIADHGVAGASHRKIAAVASVSLGSTTYHFDGIDEILHEAFSRFAHTNSKRFDKHMRNAQNCDDAKRVLADLISNNLANNDRGLIITHELYALAARDPRFRDITADWMGRSRQSLEHHFDPITSRILDALVEGLIIHGALDTQPHDLASVRAAIDQLTGKSCC